MNYNVSIYPSLNNYLYTVNKDFCSVQLHWKNYYICSQIGIQLLVYFFPLAVWLSGRCWLTDNLGPFTTYNIITKISHEPAIQI